MSEQAADEKCPGKTEVYSRVCGFFRPVTQWNHGKKEEFRERVVYKPACPQGDET